eukprot:scaffold5816_cov57-Phaeocystis_antarctica.AAC.8
MSWLTKKASAFHGSRTANDGNNSEFRILRHGMGQQQQACPSHARARWGGLGTSLTVLPDARDGSRRAQLTHQADSSRALRGRAGRAQPQDVVVRGLALAQVHDTAGLEPAQMRRDRKREGGAAGAPSAPLHALVCRVCQARHEWVVPRSATLALHVVPSDVEAGLDGA